MNRRIKLQKRFIYISGTLSAANTAVRVIFNTN